MSFVKEARAAATTWKHSTSALSAGAREPGFYRGKGPYPFCLPEPHAAENLLLEARAIALDRFAAVGIQWHAAIDDGPTNHLLSSQIQCVNALAPFVDAPAALAELFGDVLPIAEVLPFGGGATPTDHVVFEWIGLQDYLQERKGGTGTRGANTTSVDAAIRYRTPAGSIELALIEWKYVERYTGAPLHGGAQSMDKRLTTYRPRWTPSGPVRTDLLAYEQLFVEPVYQLFRQQCLAAAMEGAQELDAETVRLCVAAPAANGGYWLAVPDPLAPRFPSVHVLWAAVQRNPDRFVSLDTATLIGEESPCSEEFKRRYAHLADPVEAPLQEADEADPADRLLDAANWALQVLRRVSAERGVLQQLVDAQERVQELPADEARRLAARLEELTELTRQVRAEELNAFLNQPPTGPGGAAR